MSPAAPKSSRTKRKAKKRSKSERRQLEQQLDTLTSLIVRWRDGKCVVCGSDERLQCGHLIKRGKRPSRWSLRNCNTQCASCNFRHNNYPEAYTRWFIKRYGEAEYDAVCDDAFSDKKYTVPELRDMAVQYQKLWDDRPALYTRGTLEALGYFGVSSEPQTVGDAVAATYGEKG